MEKSKEIINKPRKFIAKSEPYKHYQQTDSEKEQFYKEKEILHKIAHENERKLIEYPDFFILLDIYRGKIKGIFTTFNKAKDYSIRKSMNNVNNHLNESYYGKDFDYEKSYNDEIKRYSIINQRFNLSLDKPIYVLKNGNDYIYGDISRPDKYLINDINLWEIGMLEFGLKFEDENEMLKYANKYCIVDVNRKLPEFIELDGTHLGD